MSQIVVKPSLRTFQGRATIQSMATLPRTRRIGFLGYQQITALDLVGPMEVFSTANDLIGADAGAAMKPPYELVVLGLNKRTFLAESGAVFMPQVTLAASPTLDTLVVPGGRGLREPAQLQVVTQWLRKKHRSIRRIASVCTGIYALAEAGLLDGRDATTHWRHAETLAARYPEIRVNADAIFIKQDRVYTSAGITAGIDLALALVEEDHGPRWALAVARELVVFLKRAGGQSQYSERLSFQAGTAGRLAELGTWMLEHLSSDLSVERLAERCQISPRQLTRRFQQAMGVSPAAYVERLRTEEASHRLLADNTPIERIAEAVGFASTDVFRRAFERRFGVAPAQFRARFSTYASASASPSR
jgi:transcriptional regulator GlxA family with amidase domain